MSSNSDFLDHKNPSSRKAAKGTITFTMFLMAILSTKVRFETTSKIEGRGADQDPKLEEGVLNNQNIGWGRLMQRSLYSDYRDPLKPSISTKCFNQAPNQVLQSNIPT